MTTARSLKIDLEATSYYHCMARCVRRHYLCGIDRYTNKDYSHRKKWIVNRLKFLASVFSIQICAYAIMSNHYHVVLHVDDKVSTTWHDDEVINRWSLLFPKDAKQYQHIKEKINLWRERLTSISWFMRCLNESIARAANDEDDCMGRFWEGRFKSQALLDDGALLSAMIYVDLNPIRAGLAETPEQSDFTSIHERIKTISKQLKNNTTLSKKPKNDNSFDINRLKQPKALLPFIDADRLSHHNFIDFKLSDYLDLVDYSGRSIKENKRGAIPSHLATILDRLQFNETGWLSLIQNFEKKFYHAVGNEVFLLNFSKKRNHAIKGLQSSREMYLSA